MAGLFFILGVVFLAGGNLALGVVFLALALINLD